MNRTEQNRTEQNRTEHYYSLLTNNFKFLFQIQKSHLFLLKNIFAILNNNIAFVHCVNNSEGRKIANAHKGFSEGVQKEKPLVIRNDNYNNVEKHDNKAVLTPCVNNVAFACCVNNSRKSTQGAEAALLSTSINSDSLSRKIKNPCSVINNFKLLRRIFSCEYQKQKQF